MVYEGAIAVFLITLGLGQLISTQWGLRAASLVGPGRLVGYGLGTGLVVAGAWLLPQSWSVLFWTFLAGPLVVGLQLLGGAYIVPPPHPNQLFRVDHPAHGSCLAVQIPDGEQMMPGLLLRPAHSAAAKAQGAAVCLVHGAGDTKTSFKWRLIQAFLAEGLTVLTIDLPGHGDYRHYPLAYPDCLTAIPAAIKFLQTQPGVERVGLAGISLGGALAIRSLAEHCPAPAATGPVKGTQPDAYYGVKALVAFETPVRLRYSRALFYGEMWRTYYGAPVLSLLKEMSCRQMWQSWHTGGYRSRHNTAELIDLLRPLEHISRLKEIPILIVYSRRDLVAPPAAALALQEAAPQATLLESKKASHVTLTLIPEINRQVACWLRGQLS